MLYKCAVKNIGAAARCADNEYWTVYLDMHLAAPRFSVHFVFWSSMTFFLYICKEGVLDWHPFPSTIN